jgi:cytochrome c oxidase subunit 4
MATSAPPPAAPEQPPAPAPPEQHPAKHSRPSYVGIWVALAVLTGVELTVAFLPWPKVVLILLLIGMAIWKALLVALYYMHLRFEQKRLRLLALAPLPFCVIFVTAILQEHFR